MPGKKRGDGALVQIAIDGESFKDIADQIIEEEVARAREAVNQSVAWLEEEVVRNLSRPGPERAAEGEPPRMQSGELVRTVRRSGARLTRAGTVTASISVRHPGANRLEFGKVDKKGRRTPPHPFVRPAFEKLRAKIEALLRGLDT